MEKQRKVVNKIKSSLAHGNEGQLGTKNNDECYTSMQDILNELSYWAMLDKFKGKNIICPCDWDIVDKEEIYAIRIDYKDSDIEVTGNNVYKAVKSVEYSLFDFNNEGQQVITKINLNESEIEDFLRNKLTCNFLRTLTQQARKWGIKSITASGYNPANGKGIKFQDIDYSKYDICITNPPFSLYKEFMNSIVGHIDFIVLAPLMNRVNPCIGLPLMLKQAYLGHGIELHMTFDNPTKENNYSGVKVVNCDWITSFSEAQEERNNKHFKSGISYEVYKDEYVIMPNMTMKDGTHPIRVSMSTYPEDYDGWMFATIGVLDNLDQSAYEFYVTECRRYLNENLDISPFENKILNDTYLDANGKKSFGGIVFRKKVAKNN